MSETLLEHVVGVLGFVDLSITVLLLCLILELINEIDDLFKAGFPSACFIATNGIWPWAWQ